MPVVANNNPHPGWYRLLKAFILGIGTAALAMAFTIPMKVIGDLNLRVDWLGIAVAPPALFSIPVGVVFFGSHKPVN